MKARFPQLSAVAGGFLLAGSMFSPSALAIDFSDCGGGFACPYVAYGDGQSYSLPVSALLWDYYQGGGTGPSNPFYVTSTPGAIKNLTVIGTGASGVPVTTNDPGMDDSYPTPNADSGGNFFSTNKTAYGGTVASCEAIPTGTSAGAVTCALPSDPGGPGEFAGDTANTWDIRLSALKSFLGDTASPIFFFNNNQVNSGASEEQNLAIWAHITLVDTDAADPTTNLNLYFTNLLGPYLTIFESAVQAAKVNGAVGTGVVGDHTNTSTFKPTAGTNAATDYVLSGGELCYKEVEVGPGVFTLVGTSCADPDSEGTINHNLGADQAVYAVIFPKLNEIMATAGFNGFDVLQLDWRMGCDPFTTNAVVTCQGDDDPQNHGRFLNNGYEQLFLASTESVIVPLPSSAALLGIGLLGLAAWARRRNVTQ